MSKLRWGILSTAKIGVDKVVPAMQRGQYCTVAAIASRDLTKARATADRLGVARAYGSYKELLADSEIDVVYNPLPNHLHVPWSLQALAAGKHVLCEKPIGMTADEGQQLVDAARKSPFRVMEAFMYRLHPQWQRAKALVRDGRIGALRTIHTFFSYHNLNPHDIRNQADAGGGALMDIGCYAISLSRWLFDAQPQRVIGHQDFDPRFGVDRLTSAMMQFTDGMATFTCGTQIGPQQRVNIVGEYGRIEIEIPFNAPPDRPCRLWLHRNESKAKGAPRDPSTTSLIAGATSEEILVEVCDQYTAQGDAFARSVLDDIEMPTPIEDAVDNMRVIEAIVRSAQSGKWERP